MRAALLALLAALHSCWALDDGLALQPPLGLNTWNVSVTHSCARTEPLVTSVPCTASPLEALAPGIFTCCVNCRPSTTKSTRLWSRRLLTCW